MLHWTALRNLATQGKSMAHRMEMSQRGAGRPPIVIVGATTKAENSKMVFGLGTILRRGHFVMDSEGHVRHVEEADNRNRTGSFPVAFTDEQVRWVLEQFQTPELTSPAAPNTDPRPPC